MIQFCPNCYVALPAVNQSAMEIDGDDSPESTALSSSTSTHPSTLTPPSHYDEFEDFKREANLAFQNAFPIHRQPRNSRVGVLLLRFKHDGLGVISEMAELRDVFESVYGYEVESFDIPDEDPQQELSNKIYNFRKRFCDIGPTDNCQLPLLIVYYGGHAAKPRVGQNRCLWSSNRDEGRCAQLNWTVVQPILFDAPADVLVLLDCCYASSAASRAEAGPIGAKETIAACGPASKAFGVGESSFTTALISELKDHAQKQTVLTSANLQAFLVQNHRLKFQPVYVRSDPSSQRHSACLIPFSGSRSQVDDDIWKDPRRDAYSVTIRVVLSVHSRKSPTSELVGYLKNERSMPSDVMGMSVENISRFKPVATFASFSTMTIVSVPLAVWNVLPDHDACQFVGLVTSENMLDNESLSEWDFAKAGSQTDRVFGQDNPAGGYKQVFEMPRPTVSDSGLGSELPYNSDSDTNTDADELQGEILDAQPLIQDVDMTDSVLHDRKGPMTVQANTERPEASSDISSDHKRPARACLRCFVYRMKCDDKDPCSQCQPRMRAWRLPCTRARLEDRSDLLLPDFLVEPLSLRNMRNFVETNADFYCGEAFELPLTLGIGDPFLISVREVQPLGPVLSQSYGFESSLSSDPSDTQDIVSLQSPPLVPYGRDGNQETVERFGVTVLGWCSSMTEDTDTDWAEFMFPSRNEELERRLLDQTMLYRSSLWCSENPATDSIHLGLRLLFFNIAMSRAFVVPEESVKELCRHSPSIRSLVPGGIVSPRAVNKYLKMLLLPMLRELANKALTQLQVLLLSNSTAEPDVMIVLSMLVLIVIGRTQDSIFQRVRVDSLDETVHSQATTSEKDAQILVTKMDNELSNIIIELCVFKIRRWAKRRRTHRDQRINDNDQESPMHGFLLILKDISSTSDRPATWGSGDSGAEVISNARRLLQRWGTRVLEVAEHL